MKNWKSAEIMELGLDQTFGSIGWKGHEVDYNGDGVIDSADEKAWKKAGRPFDTVTGQIILPNSLS